MLNNNTAISNNPAAAPTPTPSSDLDDVDRISPLPVFNNPAYESSSDDQLENDTASSTVSAEREHHRSKSHSQSSDRTRTAETPPDSPGGSSSKDPIEDLRSLDRKSVV